MSHPIPISRAWLALWPVAVGDAQPFRCLMHDGPLPKARMDKLSAIGGFQRPIDPEESLLELYALFGVSPGWADPVQAMGEIARVDRDPELRVQMQADIDRRRAMVVECRDWKEAVRLLVGKGEIEDFKGRAA